MLSLRVPRSSFARLRGIAVTPMLSFITVLFRSATKASMHFTVSLAIGIAFISSPRRLFFLAMAAWRLFFLLLGKSSSLHFLCLQWTCYLTGFFIDFTALCCLCCRRCRASCGHYSQARCTAYIFHKWFIFHCIQLEGQYLRAVSLQCL